MGGEPKRILRLCAFIKVLCCSLGVVALVSGDHCDSDTANLCYDELLHYETLAFPLYGEDKGKLENTCGAVNGSYGCLDQFISYCSEEKQCDENCQDLMKSAKHFIKYSGLASLFEELCSPESVLSTTYLKNVDCLYSVADSYASCHNLSQKSLRYLSTQQPLSIESRCCLIKWHDECFKNATSERCEDDATFFVSSATHKLIGHVAQKLCHGVESTCTRPPLPPGEDNGIDGHTTESRTETDLEDHTIESRTETDLEDHTTESQTESDLDNEIHDTSEAAAIRSYATNWILLHFLYILLSKYAL